MRDLKYTLLTAILSILAFTSVTYTSCNTDKCKDIVCQNGGICDKGTCACPTGYNGPLCEQAPIVIDPCEQVTCQNGGTCNNGNCTCPANYEGTYCESGINLKFAGSYNTLETCTLNGQNSYTVVITADANNPSHVLVSNLGNYSLCGTIVLDGIVTKSGGISIDDNVCNYHFVVNGDLSDNELILNYSATYGSDTETCSAHMYRQQ